MNYRISIFVKLLLFIIPLVCIPITVVGYYSIQASVERVNRLVRHEQMVQVEAVAEKINRVFYNCRIDLETITGLPVLEDFRLARMFRLEAEAEFNRDNLIKFFRDVLARTPFYRSIRFSDLSGKDLISVGRGGEAPFTPALNGGAFLESPTNIEIDGVFISNLVNYGQGHGYILHCAKPFYYGGGELAGLAVIDLDFEKIIELVKAIHVGQRGYSFLVDNLGRTLIHPVYLPYQYNLGNYQTPSVVKLVKSMMAGETGWEDYTLDGEKKVAAFAPIKIMDWSMAVTIPMEEFGREAEAIETTVIQTVAVTLLVTLLGVSILSYSLLRPVRRLVAATNRLASGDLDQEIPVQSRDELGDLTRSFNRMVRNLSQSQRELVRSEKLISLGRLSAGMAHEIRNPLNAMKGAMTHIKQRYARDAFIQQYAGLVSEEIDRLNRVVSEVLYFAKQPPPRPARADLNKVVLETQAVLADEAAQRGVRFRNSLGGGLPLINLDEHQIEQVLLNLIINAFDAMQDGGNIRFITRLREPGLDQVELIVEDDGTGISEEDLVNVCDPFFTTKDDGTGLGLPLSLGIVEAHNGSLAIESHAGMGTRVTITLPVQGPTLE